MDDRFYLTYKCWELIIEVRMKQNSKITFLLTRKVKSDIRRTTRDCKVRFASQAKDVSGGLFGYTKLKTITGPFVAENGKLLSNKRTKLKVYGR